MKKLNLKLQTVFNSQIKAQKTYKNWYDKKAETQKREFAIGEKVTKKKKWTVSWNNSQQRYNSQVIHYKTGKRSSNL